MKKKSILLFFIIFFSSLNVLALDIDEKLTLRILKHSSSKKTILINRGLEDGLIEGDHAKFFLSIGVVARGLIIKASPSRTVWSLYRLVNADYVKADSVMNLKITQPVALTDDRTRMIIADDTPLSIGEEDPRNLGIPLAQGALDLEDSLNDNQRERLLYEDPTLEVSQNISERDWEVWSVLNFWGMSQSTTGTNAENSETTAEFDSSGTTLQWLMGIEFYSQTEHKWYSRFSVSPFFSYQKLANLSYLGVATNTSILEYGASLHWAPFTHPHLSYKPITFVLFDLAVGSASDSFTADNQSTAVRDVKGSTLSYAFGFGVKYYLRNGFGARIILDYYSRKDTFDTESSTNTNWDRRNSGPRLMVGLSYRF